MNEPMLSGSRWCAGIRELSTHDTTRGVRVPSWMLYPTSAPAAERRFGPYVVAAATDAPQIEGQLPLVAISHGGGGSPWVYRDLAVRLAGEGFAVALLEHPGNSRSDNSLADSEQNLIDRPRHLSLVLDAAQAERGVGGERVVVVGHSIGGYTALAAAGGRPMNLPAHIPHEQRLQPTPEVAALAHEIPVERDARVVGVALLAPALGWFMAPGALAGVSAAVLARTGGEDRLCPTPLIERVLRGLPVPGDLVEVPGAGHFSFSSPFPAAMVRPDFPPAHDPPGFDRAAYQVVLQREVVAFARRCLAG